MNTHAQYKKHTHTSRHRHESRFSLWTVWAIFKEYTKWRRNKIFRWKGVASRQLGKFGSPAIGNFVYAKVAKERGRTIGSHTIFDNGEITATSLLGWCCTRANRRRWCSVGRWVRCLNYLFLTRLIYILFFSLSSLLLMKLFARLKQKIVAKIQWGF